MKKSVAFVGLVVVAVIAFVVFFSFRGDRGATLKVGAILPMTGWSAEFGQHEWAAIRVAVKKTQMRHEGIRINVQLEDTKSEV